MIGTPSATKEAVAASKVIACGTFRAPGIAFPASPMSGAGIAPKRAATYCQKFVLPAEVVLIEPAASVTASYVTVTPAADFTSFPEASTSWAWTLLYGGRIEKTA